MSRKEQVVMVVLLVLKNHLHVRVRYDLEEITYKIILVLAKVHKQVRNQKLEVVVLARNEISVIIGVEPNVLFIS